MASEAQVVADGNLWLHGGHNLSPRRRHSSPSMCRNEVRMGTAVLTLGTNGCNVLAGTLTENKSIVWSDVSRPTVQYAEMPDSILT